MGSSKLAQILKRAEMKRRSVESFRGMTANEVAKAMKMAKDPFLISPEWKALRVKAISMYGAKCMCCGSERSINVDHIKPRRLFPDLALDFDNLQVLCGVCNKRKGNKHMTDYRRAV